MAKTVRNIDHCIQQNFWKYSIWPRGRLGGFSMSQNPNSSSELTRTAKIVIKLSQNVNGKTAVLFSICYKKSTNHRKGQEMPHFCRRCHVQKILTVNCDNFLPYCSIKVLPLYDTLMLHCDCKFQLHVVTIFCHIVAYKIFATL